MHTVGIDEGVWLQCTSCRVPGIPLCLKAYGPKRSCARRDNITLALGQLARATMGRGQGLVVRLSRLFDKHRLLWRKKER